MRLKFLNFLLFIPILCSVCCTSYKSVPYLQDLKKDTILTQTISNYAPLTIQTGDLLGVHVSSLNRDADAIINYNLERPLGNSNLDRSEENAVIGYLVSSEGIISVPYIGDVNVKGKTTVEIAKILQEKLASYLSSPVVNVRLQNFRISVLGDVKGPGTFSLNNENITIFQALSLAGDLNTTGIRQIVLIRESNGERQTIPLDLQSKNIMSSPYFYLKNNDVIYVQPNKERVAASDSAFQKASIIISALSLVAIFITRYK